MRLRETIDIKSFITFSFIFFIFFVLNFFRTIELGSPDFITAPHTDITFYGDLAQSLIVHKQENYYNILNDLPKFEGTTPYHYFEIWVIAILSFFTGIKAIGYMELCLLPFFQSLLMFFALGLFTKKDKGGLLKYITSFCLVYISGYVPNWITNIEFFRWACSMDMNQSAMIYCGTIFLFIGTSILYKNDLIEMCSILLGLTIANFSCIPSIIGGVGLFMLYKLIQDKAGRQLYIQLFFINLALFIAILFFYKILGNSQEETFNGLFTSHLFASNAGTSLNLAIGNFITVLFVPILFFIPLLHATYKARLYFNTLSNYFYGIYLCSILTSLTTYLLLFNMIDSFQLARNFTQIGFYVIGIILFTQLFDRTDLNSRIGILFVSFVLLLNVYQYCSSRKQHYAYSNVYLSRLKTELSTTTTPFYVIVFRNDRELLRKNEYPQYIRNIHKYGHFTYNANCKGVLPYFSSESIKENRNSFPPAYLQIIEKTSWLICYRNSIPNYQTNEEMDMQLIKSRKVKYLVSTRGSQMPIYLKKISTFVCEDAQSGERLYKIKNEI